MSSLEVPGKCIPVVIFWRAYPQASTARSWQADGGKQRYRTTVRQVPNRE